VKPGYISVYQEGIDDVFKTIPTMCCAMQEGDRVKLTGWFHSAISRNRRRASPKHRWSRPLE